jgi:signal peptidase I
MKLAAGALVGIFAALRLVACGGSSSQGGHTETVKYPSASMKPAISYQEEVTVNLDAYDHMAPAVGEIVAFHPPVGAESLGGCAVRHPGSQPCPKSIDNFTGVFIKRIVAEPGDELSIRAGQPVVNGKAILTHVIQSCSSEEVCNLPKPITIPPGNYFVLGDYSGASSDSRYWGPIPRAAIFGKVELG